MTAFTLKKALRAWRFPPNGVGLRATLAKWVEGQGWVRGADAYGALWNAPDAWDGYVADSLAEAVQLAAEQIVIPQLVQRGYEITWCCGRGRVQYSVRELRRPGGGYCALSTAAKREGLCDAQVLA